MANLRVNKITGTEVFETTGSVQFDGSGDYLSFANSADFAFGTGAFTIEFWVNGPSNNDKFFLGGRSAIGTLHITTGGYDSTLIGALRYVGSSTIVSTSLVTDNFWHHCAIIRDSSNNVKLYVDGIQSASGTDTTNYTTTSGTWYFGGNDVSPASNNFNGFISNFRILKGTALYTKNFTPPTRELTVIPNTVLLCCQSTTRANEEKTGKTITVNGNAVANELTPGLLTDRIRSGGSSSISGSVEFDGTGDYLTTANYASDFNFGSSDFTMEFWSNSTKTGRVDPIGWNYDYTSAGWAGMILNISPGSGSMAWYENSSSRISGSGSWNDGSWHHIAVTRDGNSVRMFLDGTQIGSTYTTSHSYGATNSGFIIGTITEIGVGLMSGHISNLRVIKGTALYTQNFIPPTRELKNLPGTVLLCCQDSKSAAREATGKTITVNGNATARNFAPSVGFDGFVNLDGATKIKTPNYFYLPTGNTEDRGRGRGVFGGGYSGADPNFNTIDYINIQSTGNAIDFGDRSVLGHGLASFSSATRGVFGGGRAFNFPAAPSTVSYNVIDYITIQSTGNALDFGDLSGVTYIFSGCSNSTRGVFKIGGSTEYITISSTGNTISFGSAFATNTGTAFASSTRGIFAGGGIPAAINTIEYITIQSTGNALDFGDLLFTGHCMGCANSTRGIIFSGGFPAASNNSINYITMASTGNAVDFGDMIASITSHSSGSGCASPTRAVRAGGFISPATINSIEYVTISSTGNSQDFGDLTQNRNSLSGCSDSHGGLG